MTDLVQIQNNYGAIQQFAETASLIQPIAEVLATTSFVPAAYKNKPTEITAAIMFGGELGFDPMSALQAFVPIQGRPTLTAMAMRGLAIAAGVKFELRESTNTRCVYAALPAGEKQWTEVVWDIDRARQLGLLTKDNWKNQPKAMLIARATSEVCRLVAANLYIGCPYSAEEVKDGEDDERWANGDATPPAPEKKRTVKRAPVVTHPTQVFDEPEIVPAEPKAIEAVPSEDGVTAGTRKALMTAFNDRDIRARTDRLAMVSVLLGRQVESVNELSEAEAHQVLDGIKVIDDADWPTVADVPA